MKKSYHMTGWLFISLSGLVSADDGIVAISCDYPGGNVKIKNLSPGRAEVEADLRDTQQPWFYWNFEAKAEKNGVVKFLFPVKQKQVSAQGPAISTDGGKSWKWLGREKTNFLAAEPEGPRDSFSWNFTKTGERVHFAQGIPYQRANLDSVLEKYKNHPDLKVAVLTKTRKGAETPLLIIGKEAPGTKNILLTARHHSCEAIPSYAMEGFLEEALSDSPFGREFRKKYVLYAVVFVDLDGVQGGDQGKGRAPHDHNRDYGLEKPLYPEIKAIEELDREKKFFIALDLHAPSVRDDIHERFYFDGLRTPENNSATVEFYKWLFEESPTTVDYTLNFLKPTPMKPSDGKGIPFSHYFGSRPHTAYGVTIEIPYASGGNPEYDDSEAKKYGKGLLRAMMRMEFAKNSEKRTGYDDFRKMELSLTGRPDDFILNAEAILKDTNASALYKNQAYLRLGWLYPRMRKFAEAVQCDETVLNSPYATAKQKIAAAVQKTEALTGNPDTTDEALAKWLAEMEPMRISGLSRYNILETLYQRCIRKKDTDKALIYAEEQLRYAPPHLAGAIRNRIASLYLAKGEKEKAAEYSRVTVHYLRGQLSPKMPVGITGPMQAEELVNALMMIPGTPKQEIIDAANLALNHKICIAPIRKRLTAIIEKLNQ